MVEKIKFGKNVKYYKDAFTLQYILGSIGILITLIIASLSVYSTYSSYEGSKFWYLLLPVFFLIVIRLMSGSYLRKIAVDENGNVSIPGEGTDPFIVNTFYTRGGMTPLKYIQFNKANIENVELVDMSNVEKNNAYSRIFLSKTKKVVLIKFKEPLGYYAYPGIIQIGERNSLEGIYLSLGDPESFMEDISR